MWVAFLPFIKYKKMTEPFLALARKHRPKKLSELIGQDVFVSTIQNALKNNRLAHAYLFSGVRGVGKTTTARILAHLLMEKTK